MTATLNVRLVPLVLGLLLAGCGAPSPDGNQSAVNPLRIPVEPVPLTGTFSCTAYVEGNLPPINWRQIPFRQEGNRLSGLYNFKDSFGHQDSVIFDGTLTEGSAWIMVTGVRADGASNFTAEMIGNPASMSGRMMLGASQRVVRQCTLALARGT